MTYVTAKGYTKRAKRAEKNPTQRAGKVTFVTAKSPTLFGMIKLEELDCN